MGKVCGIESARRPTGSGPNRKKSYYQENRTKGLGSLARLDMELATLPYKELATLSNKESVTLLDKEPVIRSEEESITRPKLGITCSKIEMAPTSPA